MVRVNTFGKMDLCSRETLSMDTWKATELKSYPAVKYTKETLKKANVMGWALWRVNKGLTLVMITLT
jgi:hypothetical protein